MKKIISFIIIFVLFFSCFYSAVDVKADECEYGGNHVWGDWYLTSDSYCNTGLLYYRECYYCNYIQTYKVGPTMHRWGKWEIIKKSTYHKSGRKTRECTVCGKIQYKRIKKKRLTKRQKNAKKAVIKYIKLAKKYKVNKMNKMFINRKSAYGYPTKKPLPSLYRKHNKKIKYKFVTVKGKGKSISVTMDVWIPKLDKAIYNSVEDEYYELLYSNSRDAEASGDRMLKGYIKRVKKYKGKPVKTRVVFRLRKISKGWKIKKKTIRMVDIATGFYASGFSDAELDFT